MSEDRGFEVIDRRRREPANGGGASPEEVTAAAGQSPFGPFGPQVAGMPGAGDEMGELNDEGPDPVADFDVTAILRMTIGILNEKTWINMGLYANPGTGKVEKNIPEARRGIDLIADLVRHLEPFAEPDEKRELQVMLNNLRLNFVRQSG